MWRKLVLAAVTTVLVPSAAALAPGTANAATSAACINGVAVSQFAFNPSSVTAGSTSPLTLVLQNCTSQTIQGSTDWFGLYLDANGNPDGYCPVLDPIPYNYTIAPGGTYTLANNYGAPSGQVNSQCAAATLRISANINVNGAGTVQTVTAYLQLTSVCSDGVALNQFYFNPVTVNTGQYSTLSLVLQNCTSQAIQGQTSWSFQFTGSGSGIPPGCPVLDPIDKNYTIAAGGTTTLTEQLGDSIQGCPATGLKANVGVLVNGQSTTGYAATATASLSIVQPVNSACHVSYTPSNWQGGFTANVTITNTGSAALNGWTLAFTFPGDQKITNAWNAAVSQTGQNVSAANVGYNATIPAGGSQSFGFQGTWTANDASPTSFSLNGVACS